MKKTNLSAKKKKMQNKELVMGKCIELARNVKGFTLTNPLVGAAVIKGGNAVYGIHEIIFSTQGGVLP